MQNKNCTILFIFFYLLQLWPVSGKLFAQNKEIDSLKMVLANSKEDSNKVKTLEQLSNGYQAIQDINNTIYYGKEALKLAQKINFKKGEGDAYFNLGIIYRETYNLNEARNNLNEAISIREIMGDERVAFGYLALARIYVIENNYPASIKFILKALRIYEKAANKNGMAQTYSRLGFNYKAYGNYSEAIKNYAISLELFININRKERVVDNLCEIGLLNLEIGNDSLALKDILSAHNISEEVRYKLGTAYANLCLGNIYLSQSIELANKNYSSSNEKLLLAEKKCLLALYFIETTDSYFFNYGPFSQASVYNILGNVYLNLKNFSKARLYMEKNNSLALETKNRKEILASYLNLFRLDSTLGNFKDALGYYKYYITYRDSITSNENTIKIENSTMQYAFNKKEDSLKQKQLITEVKLKSHRNQKYFYWVGLGLLGLLSFFVYKNFRNQKKINRMADETHGREKAELELHSLRAQLNPHFMFNSLNAIQELILMEENEKAQSYLARFAKLLRMLLENAEKPFIPLQREIDFLKIYLSLENLRVPDLKHSIKVDPTIDTEKTVIPNMILQPYIENAIWHGLSHKKGDKMLLINISGHNGMVDYEIKDNGVGRKKSAELKSLFRKEHKSKGMELLSRRFKLLAKEYGSAIESVISDVVTNDEIAGTIVKIEVPMKFSTENVNT